MRRGDAGLHQHPEVLTVRTNTYIVALPQTGLKAKRRSYMPQTIYKYPVPILDRFVLDVPLGATMLSVQVQNGDPQVWALVDPDQRIEARDFALIGTGHDVSADVAAQYDFVGTFQMFGGTLVFHLFAGRSAHNSEGGK